MKITERENEKAILIELGERIKQQRIALGITQADMAEKCGISSSTVTRIENGADSAFSNYIKIIVGLNMIGNLDVLLPETQPDFKSLYEKKKPRQRATPSKSKPKPGWTWGEDK